MKHIVILVALVLLVTIGVYFGLDSLELLPEMAAQQAETIDWLFNIEVILIAFLFSLIVVPLIYSLVVFRRRKGEEGEGEHMEGNTRLEIVWTVIPLILVIALAYVGAWSLGEAVRSDPQAMTVEGKEPGETWQTVMDSYKLVYHSRLDGAAFNILIPLPGTRLMDELLAEGIITREEIEWDRLFARMPNETHEAYAAHLAAQFAGKSADIQTGPTDSIVFGIVTIVGLLMIVWMVALMYRAFAVSCNVSGGKSIGVFIAALVVGEAVSKVLMIAMFRLL